jgi:hypothetical protein
VRALRSIGVSIDGEALPLTVHGVGRVPGGEVTIDASASSQFVSGLLLTAAAFDHGIVVRHLGPPVPSAPHLRMTVQMLRAAGAAVDDSTPDVWAVAPGSIVPMIGASGAVSAVIGAYALSFGRAKAFTNNLRVNRWINVLWLMVAWVVLQVMMGWLAGGQGFLLATPAHVGGFAAGLLLQRPPLLWRYRKA